jgi:hypothetical protein
MPTALTITATSANGIQTSVADPISGGRASLVLFDGWIDVDLVGTSSSTWVDAIAEFDRGPVWTELNLNLVTTQASLASIEEGKDGSCGWRIAYFGPSSNEGGFPPMIHGKPITWVLRLEVRGSGARINRVSFHVSAIGQLSIGNTQLDW